jgi:hypothetical protein
VKGNQDMKKNVNTADRVIRFILGAAVLSFVFLGPQTSWGYIGLIAVVTALSGFCPVYRVLGIGNGQR